MKLQVLLFAFTVFFISCSNDKNTTELPKQVSILKSDILLQNAMVNSSPGISKNNKTYLTLSGSTLLKSTVTLQTIDTNGDELSCETFAASKMIHPEYKTANSALKEAHLREVVQHYFEKENVIKPRENAVVGM